MNRDAILATLIGFGIGLVITGLVLIAPKAFKDFPKFNFPNIANFLPKKAVKSIPTPPPVKFTVTSPLPESIEQNSSVLVSGTSEPGATVVIAGSIDEIVVTASDDGKFAGKVTLSEGANSIEVTSYKNNNIQSQSITIYSTPEDF